MAKFKYFKKATLDIHGDITLTADQFLLLSLINENREIGLIAQESGMDLAEFKKHMLTLYKMGLVEPVAQRPVAKKTTQRYSPEFLEELTSILTYYVGPVANIIMADILSDMMITDKKILVDDLGKVLSKIQDEISNQNQKVEFSKKVDKLLLRTS